jgi:hypothetical protein
MHVKEIQQMGRNHIIFYRGPKSRKPYKVRFIKIDKLIFSNSSPDTIAECIVEVEFSSMKKDLVSSLYLFSTWGEAEKIMPVHDKRLQGPRIVEVTSGKTILMENGREENGIGLRLGCLEACITTKEAHNLWMLLGKSLGYCVNISDITL